MSYLKAAIRMTFKASGYVIGWGLVTEMEFFILNGIIEWNGPFRGFSPGPGFFKEPEWRVWQCALVGLIPFALIIAFHILVKLLMWAESSDQQKGGGA